MSTLYFAGRDLNNLTLIESPMSVARLQWDIVGTKVKINNKPGGKGKIEIEYYSTEDLERLIDLFEKMK